MVFNPENFSSQLQQLESSNILYLTHFGTQVVPAFKLLEATIAQLKASKSNIVKTTFSPDNKTAENYLKVIDSNTNYKTESGIYTEAAWAYVGYSAANNTKISMIINAKALNNYLFKGTI